MNAASVSPNPSNCHANISSAGNCLKTYSEMHLQKLNDQKCPETIFIGGMDAELADIIEVLAVAYRSCFGGSIESTKVIKVKYENTLRCFNACIDENGQLDLDIYGLRAKVITLFNLVPDAWFLLLKVSEFLSKLVDWEFLYHHWQLVDKNGQRVEFRSPLVQDFDDGVDAWHHV
ncbi:hypothetical protein PVL29_013830 [Vitis rotundifolia]|uniref:Uncharacterized protein n=1 Tax=Vitis rotundifolia TaxID=103349 RepID=A0AA38ZMM3_VITRO|nr:hypothetical protein PVL29_013830 [Vitis rotundifolia]